MVFGGAGKGGSGGRRVGAVGKESQEHPSPARAAPLGAVPPVRAGGGPPVVKDKGKTRENWGGGVTGQVRA